MTVNKLQSKNMKPICHSLVCITHPKQLSTDLKPDLAVNLSLGTRDLMTDIIQFCHLEHNGKRETHMK